MLKVIDRLIPFTEILPDSFFTIESRLITGQHGGPVCIDLQSLTQILDGEHKTEPLLEWLSDSEKQRYHSFRFKKRKAEWLGGRLCAKQAIKDYIQKFHLLQTIPLPNQLIIGSLENGRPFIDNNRLATRIKLPDLSISHTRQYGMAMVSETWCGIDIQEPRPSLANVKEKYCLASEETLLQSVENGSENRSLISLTLLWTAKEALRKALSRYGLVGFLEMTCCSINKVDNHAWIFSFSVDNTTPVTGSMDVIVLFANELGIGLCQLSESLESTLSHLEKKRENHA